MFSCMSLVQMVWSMDGIMDCRPPCPPWTTTTPLLSSRWATDPPHPLLMGNGRCPSAVEPLYRSCKECIRRLPLPPTLTTTPPTCALPPPRPGAPRGGMPPQAGRFPSAPHRKLLRYRIPCGFYPHWTASLPPHLVRRTARHTTALGPAPPGPP